MKPSQNPNIMGRTLAEAWVRNIGIVKKRIATVKLGLNYGAVMFAVKMSTLQGWFDFHFKNFI